MDYIITKITTEDKKLLIEIDGKYHLFLYNRDKRKAKFAGLIEADVKLSTDEFKLLNKHVLNRGKKRIIYLLGKQDYPLSKLEAKLKSNGYCTDHIKEILQSFVEKGFIDDKKLVARRVESFIGFKSKREIEFKLKNYGFLTEDIKEALEEKFSDYDEFNSALLLLHKKFALKVLKLEQQDLKKKALSFLSRKGYPMNVCFKAYDKFIIDTKNKFNKKM